MHGLGNGAFSYYCLIEKMSQHEIKMHSCGHGYVKFMLGVAFATQSSVKLRMGHCNLQQRIAIVW